MSLQYGGTFCDTKFSYLDKDQLKINGEMEDKEPFFQEVH